MRRTHLVALAALAAVPHVRAAAQSHPRLHVNPRWEECSIQLDSSLTQAAWHQFTQEAGLVTFFRPMADARPMGRGNYEVSILQYKTGIDNADAAWNDTFVHPDSTHWLFEGNGLKFPGLMLRSGVAEKTDLSVYVTKNPGANYGFYGAEVQHALLGGVATPWAASARLSFVSLYGPEDVHFGVYGAELITSRTYDVARWASVSPYASVAGYLSHSHETSAVVSLDDEHVGGAQATFGAAVRLSAARFGIEYNVARVRSFSMKVGVGF